VAEALTVGSVAAAEAATEAAASWVVACWVARVGWAEAVAMATAAAPRCTSSSVQVPSTS